MRKTRMTAAVLLILLAALFICACCAEETLGPNMRVAHCKKDVSLRAKPSRNAKRLAKVPLGAEVLAWTDGGGEGEADDFLACEYRGKTGYILREYLEPIAEEYDTGLGFSFRYNPYRMRPDPSASESGKSVTVTWIGYEDTPAYMELMLPEAFPEDPQTYMEANTDYTDTFTTQSGATVTGGTKASADYTTSLGFYIVTQGNSTLLVSTACPTELDEIVDSDFRVVLTGISFGK